MVQYSTVIAPNDHMWATGQSWYFEAGLSALGCIQRMLAAAKLTPTAILDMPCGHGRVCRMLRAAFPAAHLTVADLDRDGVEFCAAQFGAEPFFCSEDVQALTLDRTFDLIWCGSLFTHLDRDRWPAFLEFFANHLAPGGLLVFTTHGRRPIQWMIDGVYSYGLTPQEQQGFIEDYTRDGFGFVSPAGQAFGLSLSSMSFVCREIECQRALKLVGFEEAGWSNHQDVVTCEKLAIPFPDPRFVATDNGPMVSSGAGGDRPMGHVDFPSSDMTAVGLLNVSGWAADKRGIREIRVLLDGRIVGRTTPTAERPDVSATYPAFSQGHDRHGWSVLVDLAAPGEHRLSAQAENSEGRSSELGARIVTVPGGRIAAHDPALPTDLSVLAAVRARPWFYEFDLPDGSRTESYIPEYIRPIHDTRLEMMWRTLEPMVGGDWRAYTALDLACHQGFFATHLARRGCRRVVGVDARPEHVADARLIGRLYGLDNLQVEQRDVRHLRPGDLELFDIVLVFGLLYHVENPVGLLRLARGMTRRICLIETQLSAEGPATVESGTSADLHEVKGTLALVDETGRTHGREANLLPISMCPSLNALRWLMSTVGFSRVEIVPPPEGAYEQLARGERVMAAGYVD